MKTIWKYTLDPNDLKINMPIGARILTAREQRDRICVWAEVHDDSHTEQRNFVVVATGQEMPEGILKYLGTASLNSGALIFHVYERVFK